MTTSAFTLPEHLAAKAAPTLIEADEQHFATIATSLEQSIAELSGRLDAARKEPGGIGQEAMDRDQEVHRLTARLRALRRFGLDLCLGHVVHADHPEPLYVGRLGLTDAAGRRLLLDWRSPAAKPFFAATHAQPMGLPRADVATLSINYRTPTEVMAQAEPVIRAVLPDANVPTSVRATGIPVLHGSVTELGTVLDGWLAEHVEGIACVISTKPRPAESGRVRSLTPQLAKGLEFDLVVLVEPADFGACIEGAVDRYVAMTRATQQLVILTSL